MSCDPSALKAFIQNNSLSYKENSRSYVFDCPRCTRRQKLYMEKRGGRFKCFYCADKDERGYQGRPEFALADLALMPLQEVRRVLYGTEYTGTAVALDLQLSAFFGDGDEVDSDAAIVVPEVQFPFDYYPIDHEFSKRGVEYLATRGIDLDVAREYKLRYAPAKRRVVFPVEVGDRLVGWQERIVVATKHWDEEGGRYRESAKMLSSKNIPTAQVVMFANRLQDSKHVVVCEGPIDAIKAHLCGGNVATMGKAIGPGQVETIRDPERLTRALVGNFRCGGIERVYLALDPDAARETGRLIREFSDMEVYLMTPPKGRHDLGEMAYGEVLDLFHGARRVGAGHLSVNLR